MDVYRKNPVPAIYTQLRFVRASGPCILADCPEDLPLLKQIQNIAAGNACVSDLETRPAHEIIVKVAFPDDILARTGDSSDAIRWKCYYWKMWDAESLVTGIEPAEAMDSTDSGIDESFLDSLAHPTSCLPWLRMTEEAFDHSGRKGYTLTNEMASQLEQQEKPLIAQCKLSAMKQLKPMASPKSANPSGIPSISASLRDEMLRRDNYRCIFCGQGSSFIALEVNHIIPRSLINKLHLDSALHTAPENLCVTCIKCNRGKSDHLAKEDIAYYQQAFADAGHHNHGVVQYLRTIGHLQVALVASTGLESGV